MPVVNAQMIRDRFARSMTRSIMECRIWLSATEGNQVAVDLLRGEEGAVAAAKLVETLMAHIGHETAVTADSKDARSKARRAVARIGGD